MLTIVFFVQRPELSAQEWREKYNKLLSMYSKGLSSFVENTADDRNELHDESEPAARGDGTEDEDNEGDDGLDINVDNLIEGVKTFDSKQQQFLACLEAYNDFLQVYVPPSFFIGGRSLETYTLWTTVQNLSPDEQDRRDWAAIADALTLDRTRYPTVETQLAAWYEQNLKELGSFIKEYQQEADEDDNDDEEGSSDEEENDEEEEEDNAGGGETAEEETGERKTPESVTRNSGLMSSARQILSAAFSGGSRSAANDEEPAVDSPSKQIRFASHSNAAATKDGEDGNNNDEDDDDGDDDDDGGDNENIDSSPAFETRRRTTRASARQAASTHASSKTAAEPETQDFAFDPETQQPDVEIFDDENNDENDDVADNKDAADMGKRLLRERVVTPSQQLRTEERVMVAVPLSLPAPGALRRKRAAESSTPARHVVKRAARRPLPSSSR